MTRSRSWGIADPSLLSGKCQRRIARLTALLVLAGCPAPGSANLAAQAVERLPRSVASEVYAGQELEEYLRVLQVAGVTESMPWSIRAFSTLEVGDLEVPLRSHPWAERFSFGTDDGRRLRLVRPHVALTYNSDYPFGSNDGLVWAGRGVTVEAEAGVGGRLGPITWRIVPEITWAQNASFPMVEQQASARFPYADADHPNTIDLPQRFGGTSFATFHPGQSTVRLDGRGLVLGISTANQIWGPADEYPIVLGAHGPGFLHGFAGTSHPWNIGIGRIHGRVISARLEQSKYSTVPADSALRFATGIVGIYLPPGIDGLEIGGSYFTHSPWPAEGIGLRPFFTPLAKFARLSMFDLARDDVSLDVENGIAATFFRWHFPAARLELYGEMASEDKRHNVRDLALQPEHNSAYTLGARKVWAGDSGEFFSLRGEVLNSARSHLARNRRQEPFYIHATLRQGHTHQGQVLGTPAAFQGGGSTIELAKFDSRGRLSLAWARIVRRELGRYLEAGVEDRPDAQHTIAAGMLLFRGSWDLTVRMTGAYEFGRDFVGDAVNLNAYIGVSADL